MNLFKQIAVFGAVTVSLLAPNPVQGGNVPPAGSSPARFFMPTDVPENTAGSTVKTDAQGNVHSVYRVYARGDAFYSFCASACNKGAQMKAVRFKTDGAVQNVMLALTRAGQPRVLISTSQRVHYATCDSGCAAQRNWKTTVILDRQAFGERGLDISGEAFALDAQDRPRFIMSSYPQIIASLQNRFDTYFVGCDAGCSQAQNWRSALLYDDQAWRDVQLRFNARGQMRLALIGRIKGISGPNNSDVVGYAECDSACDRADRWNAVGLQPVYVTARLTSKPTVALQLTSSGAPRVALIATLPNYELGYLRYLSCDQNCTEDNWTNTGLLQGESLYPGLGLALRGNQPVIALSYGGDVRLLSCQSNCSGVKSWKVSAVESGSDLAADKIIPYPNCTLSAWFLYDPSVAIAPDGRAVVTYSASDDSGGFARPDTTKPACKAGTDMIFARYAALSKD